MEKEHMPGDLEGTGKPDGVQESAPEAEGAKVVGEVHAAITAAQLEEIRRLRLEAEAEAEALKTIDAARIVAETSSTQTISPAPIEPTSPNSTTSGQSKPEAGDTVQGQDNAQAGMAEFLQQMRREGMRGDESSAEMFGYIRIPEGLSGIKLEDFVDSYLARSLMPGAKGINTTTIGYLEQAVQRHLAHDGEQRDRILLRVESFMIFIQAGASLRAGSFDQYEGYMKALAEETRYGEVRERIVTNYDRRGVKEACVLIQQNQGEYYRLDPQARKKKREDITASLEAEIRRKRANPDPVHPETTLSIDDISVKRDAEIAMRMALAFMDVFGLSAKYDGPTIKKTVTNTNERGEEVEEVTEELIEFKANSAAEFQDVYDASGKLVKDNKTQRKYASWRDWRKMWEDEDSKVGEALYSYVHKQNREAPTMVKRMMFLTGWLRKTVHVRADSLAKSIITGVTDLVTFGSGYRNIDLDTFMGEIRDGKFDTETFSDYGTMMKKAVEGYGKAIEFLNKPFDDPNEAIYATPDKMSGAVGKCIGNLLKMMEFFGHLKDVPDRKEMMKELMADSFQYLDSDHAWKDFEWRPWGNIQKFLSLGIAWDKGALDNQHSKDLINKDLHIPVNITKTIEFLKGFYPGWLEAFLKLFQLALK